MNAYCVNQVVHGFRVVSVHEGEEPRGRAVRMIHEKTGAEMFWLDNGSENMVFSISFRTIPKDSSGVFHILEHSVLCGSRLYPVREPFVELLKSSMNTFLNAMTFPDMTMYPVSSRNFRDLMNLTRVYLDAVFHPIALTDRKRFSQEGWHIERGNSGKYEFGGVVYNEMKGAMSDPDTQMDRQIIRQLFPDTGYGFNSGGDPERMTELTWEEYREQYRTCYHPSNAYIYLDGGIEAEEMLRTINEAFEGFDRQEVRPEFRLQEPVASEETIYYEISPDEETTDHSHLTIAYITGTWRDRAVNLARSIICDVLTGGNEAPMKKAALERKLCRDLNMSVDDTGLQSWISIHAENVTDGKEKELRNLIEETGRRISETGLDRNAVEASMNRLIFSMREDDEPQGISRCIRVMSTWLYGGDPVDALQTMPLIRELRLMTENGDIDKIAADMLLNQSETAVLHSLPSRSAGEEKRKEEEERLKKITDAWTDFQRSENERFVSELKAWQQTPDPDYALKKLPILTKDEAGIFPKWTETDETVVNGIRIMYHRIPCNGVVYLRFYFPLTGFTLDELTKAAMFSGMLGRLPTRRHDAFGLQQEIKRSTGSLGFAIITRTTERDDDNCTPYLMAFASALEEKAESAIELLIEILTQTITEGQEHRILDMMNQNEISARQRVISSGHLIAVKSVLSCYNAENAVRNALDGEPAVRYIHRFAASPQNEMTGFLQTAQDILQKAVSRTGMILSVSGTREINLNTIIEAFPVRLLLRSPVNYQSRYPQMLGFRISSQTGFMARGYNLKKCGTRFSGITWLAGSILTLEYLWNRIRVQGGSYGAGFQTDRNGNVFSYSFRDPTPYKTMDADKGASAFLKSFAANAQELDKYIISSLNELNPLLSPREESAVADSRRMSGITKEETERIRMEILHAKGEDLIQCAEWLDSFSENGGVCIAGPKKMLEACGKIDIWDI